jgi:hypothetical protein
MYGSKNKPVQWIAALNENYAEGVNVIEYRVLSGEDIAIAITAATIVPLGREYAEHVDGPRVEIDHPETSRRGNLESCTQIEDGLVKNMNGWCER